MTGKEKYQKLKAEMDQKTQSEMDIAIWRQVYKLVENMGGDSDILSTIGSRYDTLDDVDILFDLQTINSGESIWASIIAQRPPNTNEN